MKKLMRSAGRYFARLLYLRDGTRGRVRIGPYKGLTFVVSDGLSARLRVFIRAYEPPVQRALEERIRPGMLVYVVGAHVGIHVLHAARLVGEDGLVCAFEPWPDNFRQLLSNVQANPDLRSRIWPTRAALGPAVGTCTMLEGRSDGTHRVAASGESAPSRRHVSAPQVTLDDWTERNAHEPHLILIDAEGYEEEILNGASRTLARNKPRLVIEPHGPERRRRLADLLEGKGFRVEDLSGKHVEAY